MTKAFWSDLSDIPDRRESLDIDHDGAISRHFAKKEVHKNGHSYSYEDCLAILKIIYGVDK